MKKFAPVKIGRLLTDGGTEFTTWHEEAAPNHEFLEDLPETRDRAYHNQSKTSLNKWLCRKERLNKTLLDEFYSVALKKEAI